MRVYVYTYKYRYNYILICMHYKSITFMET